MAPRLVRADRVPALGERAVDPHSPWRPCSAAGLLGWTFFTNTVKGGTWWLLLVATAVFVPWAIMARRPLLVPAAAAFGLTALMIGIWALWHQGMPQFSDVGLL